MFGLIKTGVQGLDVACGLRSDKGQFGYDCYEDTGNMVFDLIKSGVGMVVIRMLEILSSV